MRFDELRLAEPILRAVVAEGYSEPTPIQIKAIPHVLDGRDVLGCAQTGTGKTAAFALPILQRLSQTKLATNGQHEHHHRVRVATHDHPQQSHAAPRHRPGPARRIRSLVLSPTRELASQIADSFRQYGRFTGLRHTVVYGGVSQSPQTRALRDGVDILVATPGRLLDLMEQGFVDLRGVEIFVLDEADRMLDMGFIPDIRKVVAKLPAKRQTLFFSATMPTDIRQLADTILHQPVTVHVPAASPMADNIDQRVYFVEKRNKTALLTHCLRSMPVTRTLVFTRTKHGADRVVKQLTREGIDAAAIHGEKSQGQRERALANFRSNKTAVLVATDIAARGLDIDDISHVVNYDLPNVPETYVHRIGRTARAGASGIALSFCDHDERPHLKAIERLIRRTIVVNRDQPAFAAHSVAAGSSHSNGHAPHHSRSAPATQPPTTGQKPHSVHRSNGHDQSQAAGRNRFWVRNRSRRRREVRSSR